jgi:hypothetical protein
MAVHLDQLILPEVQCEDGRAVKQTLEQRYCH